MLIFDDHGQHQGVSTAELIAQSADDVELVTPDRASMQELGNSNFAVHLANLYRAGVRLTPDQRLLEVKPIGNRLRATLVNEYTGMTTERSVGQVVVERGPLAVDELYHELVDDSRNRGEVDPAALASGDLEMPERNPGADYWLIRIGDALRACKDLQPPDGVFRRS